MKKLIAMLLALVMVLSLAACGASAPAPTEAPKAEEPKAEAPAEPELVWGRKPFEEKQTLRVGFFTGSPLSYPFLFADNLGIFEQLNIELEYTCSPVAPL